MIAPQELRSNMPLDQRRQLWFALSMVEFGQSVQVCFTYRNQTDAPKAVAGQDYLELPGVAPNCMMGVITEVCRRQDDNGIYFRMFVWTRSDGTASGAPRSFRPEGIQAFAFVTPWGQPKQAPAQSQDKQQE